jgi:hypothetical protein
LGHYLVYLLCSAGLHYFIYSVQSSLFIKLIKCTNCSSFFSLSPTHTQISGPERESKKPGVAIRPNTITLLLQLFGPDQCSDNLLVS